MSDLVLTCVVAWIIIMFSGVLASKMPNIVSWFIGMVTGSVVLHMIVEVIK